MDLDNYNSSGILHAVLLRNKGDHRRAFYNFDKSVPLNDTLYLTKCLNLQIAIAVGEVCPWHRAGAFYFYHLSQCSVPCYRVIRGRYSNRVDEDPYWAHSRRNGWEIHGNSCSKFPKFPQMQTGTGSWIQIKHRWLILAYRWGFS